MEEILYDYTLCYDGKEVRYTTEDEFYAMKDQVADLVAKSIPFSVVDNEFGTDVTQHISSWTIQRKGGEAIVKSCNGTALFSTGQSPMVDQMSGRELFKFIRNNYEEELRQHNLR